MKASILAMAAITLLAGSSASVSAASCPHSEGDDFVANGKYLWADSCKLHGNIEAVNKGCTKAKVRVSKVTGAFGMKINEKCRIAGADGAAGDVIWVDLEKK